MTLALRVTAFLVAGFLVHETVSGGIVTYKASSGLLPEATGAGWVTTSTGGGSVAVAGGRLSINTPAPPPGNRRTWVVDPVPFTGGASGVFMEATVRVTSETHTSARRGLALAHVQHGDGVTLGALDAYLWEDRVFLSDVTDTTIATYMMDTKAAFHTYRLELLFGDYWLFVNDALVLSGTALTGTTTRNFVSGRFGDDSSASYGISDWKSVRVGSLDEIGGPTVPEPGSLALLGGGALGMFFVKRRGARRP